MDANFKSRAVMRSGATAFAVLLMALSCLAQPDSTETVKEKVKKFELYNGCLPMVLIVEELPPDAEEIGLSKEAVQNALESRLRAARLYITPENTRITYARAKLRFPDMGWSAASLYARVFVVRNAFSISLKYRKSLFDKRISVYSEAITWERGTLGISGKNTGLILNSLTELTDEFLAEYLRVNEADC